MTPSAFSQVIEQIRAVPQELQSHVLAFIHVLTNSATQNSANQKLAIKGTYHDGTVEISEAINKRNGQTVIVTFLEDIVEEPLPDDSFWSELDNILNDCQIPTGISDLAAQHDHYIHGIPKRDVV